MERQSAVRSLEYLASENHALLLASGAIAQHNRVDLSFARKVTEDVKLT
jgi:DNA-binding IscR family transcriptional regulator